MVKILITLLLLFCENLQAFIPMTQIKEIDSVFTTNGKIFSPLHGFIILKNKKIENLFHSKTNNEQEKLVEFLFTMLPGGKITSSHIGNNPGAHIGAETIGKIINHILLELEKTSYQKDVLIQEIQEIIINDLSYQKSLEKNKLNISIAQLEYDRFLKKYEQSKIFMNTYNKLDKEKLVPLYRLNKKNKKELSKLQKKNKENHIQIKEIETLICKTNEEIEKVKQEMEIIKTKIINKQELKTQQRKLEHSIHSNNNDSIEYEKKLDELSSLLVSSLTQQPKIKITSSHQINFETIEILNAYLWEKLDSKEKLKPYIEALTAQKDIIGSNYNTQASLKDDILFTDNDYAIFSKKLRKTFFKKNWIKKHYSESIYLLLSQKNSYNNAPIIPFSYVKWATYSTFPDCGENALHNLFNQIIFSPLKNIFDHELLEKLKEKTYNNMSQELIEYYKKYPNPEDHLKKDATKDWITVASNLNEKFEPLSKEEKVHYRSSTYHLASPYSNLSKAFSRLLGIKHVSKKDIPEFLKHISNERKWLYSFDQSNITEKGFGSISLKNRFETFKLYSHRPVHFSFAKEKNMEKSSDKNYTANIIIKMSRIKAIQNKKKDTLKIKNYRWLLLNSLIRTQN